MTVLIDSDVLIEVLRGRDATIIEKWRELAESSDALLCSPVSVVELWQGARPRERTTIAKLLGALSCVPIDAQTGQRAGTYLRQYHESHGIEVGDALIAAAAAQHRAALWTRNRKHYPMHGRSFY